MAAEPLSRSEDTAELSLNTAAEFRVDALALQVLVELLLALG